MAVSPITKFRRRFSTATTDNSSTNASANESFREKNNASPADLKAATKHRRNVILVACACYLLSMTFLILVLAGNGPTQILRNIYFYRFDLSEVIPPSQPNAQLVNSVARAFGLHDFYQVGLWNYCSGFHDGGVTYCSESRPRFWFNPVRVLMDELMQGQTIALPNQVLDMLEVLRVCSQVMAGFFVAGIVLATLLLPLTPLAIKSRWWSLPLAIVSCLAALMLVIASVIATAITLVFRMAAESQAELNINVEIGTPMWAFMWLSAGFAVLGFLLHAGMGCCCTSRRKAGRKLAGQGEMASDAGSLESRGVGAPGREAAVVS